MKLERNFTKQEIMALYLNTVPFSDNVYGIRNASRTFFSKEPDRLNVEEAAVLVGMLKGTIHIIHAQILKHLSKEGIRLSTRWSQ